MAGPYDDCMSLRHCIARHAQSTPSAPALLAPDLPPLTYSELCDAIARAGPWLVSHGLGSASRIAVCLPQGMALAIAVLAIGCHATVVALHPGLAESELAAQLADARVDAVLGLPGDQLPARLAQEQGAAWLEFDLERWLHGLAQTRIEAALPDLRDRPGPDDTAFVLFTSGTTGKPKRVPLTHRQVLASAGNIARHLALAPDDRGLCLMPLFHSHGLVGGLLAPLVAGSSVVCTPGFDGAAFLSWIERFAPTWYTAAPTIHRAAADLALQAGGALPAHKLRFIRSASSALPPALLQRMESVWGAPVIESYGMTESATQMASNPLPPGLRKIGSVGLAAGAQLRVVDAEGNDKPTGAIGVIVARGPAMFSGYEDAPAANAQAFRDGWFVTGDLGRFDDEGYLYVIGRDSDIINRGGEKFAPFDVEQALLRLHGVAQAAAYPVPHPTLGEDVHAAVVLERGRDADPDALRTMLFGGLASFKIPARIHIIGELPTSPGGKLQRRRLHEQIALATRASSGAARDFTTLETQVATLFTAVLGHPVSDPGDNFLALGGDSLSAARLAQRVNERWGVELSASALLAAPTVGAFAARLQAAIDDADALDVRRRLLARRLLQQQRAQEPASTQPAAAPLPDEPLSFAQEGLWFLDLLADGSAAYNIHSVTQFEGALDVARLEQALRLLIARHPSLRTSFHATEQGPVQRVMCAQEAQARFGITQLDATPQDGSAATLEREIAASIARPFDLSCAPLLRADLLRVAHERHVLVLVVHHIVADGWSMSIIHRELGLLYAPGAATRMPAPPALVFGDHARRQRERFEHGEMGAALDYWRSKLQGLQTLQLPADMPHPPQAGSAGRTLAFRIDDALAGTVRDFARQHDATLFMALLAAFQGLLMRYTGQDDVAVGVPLAGRDDARVRDVVGFFVNMLVLRADLGGEPSYAELVRRCREGTLEALVHQAMPFDRLVSELSPVRDASRNPLYQVSFALENFEHRVLQLEGLHGQRLNVHSQSAKFDLSLTVIEAGAGLDAEIEYRTDLFAPQTIERMAGHFQRLLAAMVAQPGRPVARLPFLDEAERHRLLVEWNDTARPLANDRPAHAHVRDQALRTPQAVALRFGRDTMSYAQLDALSQQLAHQLRRKGVGPEVPVGVCMKRGFGLAVGLLAVLKSGGTLLPLDPDHPRERMAAMLADAAPALVLSQPPHGDVLRQPGTAPAFEILEVHTDGARMPIEPLPALDELSRPDHLAYLVYTSGSTGTPKAAQLTHRGLCNHVLWMNDVLRLAPEDRVLQKTSINFDASLWEFLSTLSAGAQLVLAQPEAHRDMSLLADTVREHGITVVQFVPSELRVIMSEPAMQRPTRLRYVLSGGEALDTALARTVRTTLPGVTLGNFYGPSEAAVDSAFQEVGEPLPQRRIVPIGRPIANVQLYVLDAWQQPQPVNVAGELYVGGVGVGRGYLNRPELSAEKLVPNPFRPDERMYRTGDLARWLNDGVVEFMGRNDHQVKLRGFRIELGEIEAGLHDCPGVTAATVLMREDLPGHKELVAYVVGEAGANEDALRAELKARLPEYMIPAAWVFLSALPQLPNGKIDRRRLPPPGCDAMAASRIAPHSPIESVLLEQWQAVLGRSGFGVRNNFFDLGGHSLLATQIASRISATFNVHLPVRCLFEHPTIEALAQVVARLLDHSAAHDAAATGPIAVVSRARPALVSFSQRSMWIRHATDPRGAAYNMREALRLRGDLRREVLREALNQLVAGHEAFRTTFELAGAEPVAIIGSVQPANLVEVDARAWTASAREEQLEREARHIAAQPFDLQHAPLHRFALFQLGEQDHALVLVMHHIIGDAWSWGILLRELQALYRAGMHGKALPSPPARAIDFVDYANWQRRHVDEEVLRPQVHYWLQQLAGMSPLELPVDNPAVRRTTSEGARVQHPLCDDPFAEIQRFSGQQGVSSFMTLLAAFQWMLSRYCGQDDVAVGTPIAGRTRVEAEDLVGSLVNTLVLRCVVQPEQSFRDLLGQVREMCLSAFTHQDVPLDDLVGYLREHGGGQRIPEVRVMFNLLNTPRPALALEGIEIDCMPVGLGATQFDLALTIDTESDNALYLSYSTELFSAASAQAMLDNYVLLLRRLVREPDRPMREHAIASPQELAKLAAWNGTTTTDARDGTVNDLLAHHCASEGIALRQQPGDAWTYGQLWSRVHRLARWLRGQGVQRGKLVGLSLKRDAGMVLAQLAVLRAGAAYVPLDPSYPQQRLHDMARHAGLALLLTQSDLAGGWDGLQLPTCLLDTLDPAWDETAPGEALAPDIERDARPDDPAYVIHTSGSTGKPKGVMVPHRAVVNFLQSMQREPGLRQEDVLLAVTTLSFDIAVLELLLPLVVGATVVLATRDQAVDGAALRELLECSGATAMQATPATWQMLIDAGWRGSPGFKALIGGESLSEHMARSLSVRTGELWNMYGPTETTVWSTCWKVPSAPGPISIGRPIANTTVHVLDPNGQPCPIGCYGEIFIGGDGVALGYLNDAALSAGRFVPDPFSPDPHARMYRTGDRGRWRHDGLLEHQGRLDFQVKVRGHRIEPGEIEAQLLALQGISQCVVMAREDRPGDVRLVAYLVAAEGTATDAASLNGQLRRHLPDYMLPQHYVRLQALPLLPNGKLNRHALSAPPSGPAARREIRAQERTPAETALARVWAEMLGVDPDEIDLRDNFFDLGGDSLKAARAVIHFERACGRRLESKRLIFETLAQLAHGVELTGTATATAAAGPTGDSWLKRLFRNRR